VVGGRTTRPATDGAVGPTTTPTRTSWYAQREAAREAAWQAELEALAEEHGKRVAAAKKLHAAQVRSQKEFLRSIGVADLSPEQVMERARRHAVLAYREERTQEEERCR
jgi:hypothetical protein